jgi:RimJ/RimL family protein N-acetyltransferase
MFAITERLLLRPGWREDAPALTAAIGDEAILTKLARAPSPYRLVDAEGWLGRDRAEDEADFLIFTRDDGQRLIGGVGLSPDAERGAIELGYWIARPYWGQGFATEAARAVVDTARETLRLKRLVSGHFVDNPASGRVLAKLGFKPTGEIVARMSRARGQAVPCRLLEADLDGDVETPMVPRPMAA